MLPEFYPAGASTHARRVAARARPRRVRRREVPVDVPVLVQRWYSNTEYRIQNVCIGTCIRYRINDTTALVVQNAEWRMENTEIRIQKSEYRIQNEFTTGMYYTTGIIVPLPVPVRTF